MKMFNSRRTVLALNELSIVFLLNPVELNELNIIRALARLS